MDFRSFNKGLKQLYELVSMQELCFYYISMHIKWHVHVLVIIRVSYGLDLD